MKTLSKTFAFALTVTAFFVAFGAAATLALGSTSLSAGSQSVTTCGASAVSATRTVDNSGNVTQVDVSGIPAACTGETLSVTLANSSNAALSTLSTTLSGCSTTCSATFAAAAIGTVSATALKTFQFAITGA
jgi:hypothetical protein